MVLSKLPNGMWSESQEVQVYLPLAKWGQASKADVSKSVEAALIFVLTGTKPHLFPRHRWTGSDLSVEELGRVECAHKLLTATSRRFMMANSKLHRVTAAPEQDIGLGHGIQPTEASASGLDSSNASGLLRVNMDSSEALESIVTSAGAEKERSAAMHAQDRQTGNEWLTSDKHSPLSMLVLLRVTMQPLVTLLKCQLDVGSLDWELKQQAQNALYLASPDTDAQHSQRRSYQATVSSDGLLEKESFALLAAVFQNPLELIEEQQQHVSLRALAFKLLRRQGALVYDGLTVVHRKYPVALFKLLQHPEHASAMYEEACAKPCLLDSWTTQMVKRFP
eukprot:6462950-Amphidinium_carterae.1